jgi:hypothetical protein
MTLLAQRETAGGAADQIAGGPKTSGEKISAEARTPAAMAFRNTSHLRR